MQWNYSSTATGIVYTAIMEAVLTIVRFVAAFLLGDIFFLQRSPFSLFDSHHFPFSRQRLCSSISFFSGSVARAAKFCKGGSDSSVFSDHFPLIILERERVPC